MDSVISWTKKVLLQTGETKRKKGVVYTLRALIRENFKLLLNPFAYAYYKNLLAYRTFSLEGRDYKYFYHFFNLTWENERCVEIPIINDFINRYKKKNILEIGNVLSYYQPINHDVLDKYEIKPGVINTDVVDYNPTKKYDLIVSISTIEHVGYDEEEKDSAKIQKAVDNIKNCLSSGGKMILTFSLGYNLNLDHLILNRILKFDEQYYLKRISWDNRWAQVKEEEIKGATYAKPYPSGNALFIGIIHK